MKKVGNVHSCHITLFYFLVSQKRVPCTCPRKRAHTHTHRRTGPLPVGAHGQEGCGHAYMPTHAWYAHTRPHNRTANSGKKILSQLPRMSKIFHKGTFRCLLLLLLLLLSTWGWPGVEGGGGGAWWMGGAYPVCPSPHQGLWNLVKCLESSCTSISILLKSLSSFLMAALSRCVRRVHGLSARRSYSCACVTSM